MSAWPGRRPPAAGSELRDLAERAPGAAVTGAYQLVSATLAELLARNDVSGEAQTGGIVLAQIAASSGLVSEQLLQTVQGLTKQSKASLS